MSESDTPSPWGLILAGGDGTRLRPLTRLIVRDERPKQFCPVLSNETLLEQTLDRKSTRLNSSHGYISYAVFCLKKKNQRQRRRFALSRQAHPAPRIARGPSSDE